MDEFEILGAEEDRLIMSDGLHVDLGEVLTVEQLFSVNDIKYICTLTQARFKSNKTRPGHWEFCLEVPGLSLTDLLCVENMTFHYGDAKFSATAGFDLTNVEGSPMITFTANRIFNTNEQ